jgi:hypothetical protein
LFKHCDKKSKAYSLNSFYKKKSKIKDVPAHSIIIRAVPGVGMKCRARNKPGIKENNYGTDYFVFHTGGLM